MEEIHFRLPCFPTLDMLKDRNFAAYRWRGSSKMVPLFLNSPLTEQLSSYKKSYSALVFFAVSLVFSAILKSTIMVSKLMRAKKTIVKKTIGAMMMLPMPHQKLFEKPARIVPAIVSPATMKAKTYSTRISSMLMNSVNEKSKMALKGGLSEEFSIIQSFLVTTQPPVG